MTDEDKRPGIRVISITNQFITTSSSTATLTLGGDIWKATELPPRPPPDNPIYPLVGQIASNWSHVEHTLDILIWELAKVEPEAGACVTAQMMGAYSRFKAVIALLTLYQRRTNRNLKSLIDTATELSQKANVPSEKRNRAVHDPWYDFGNGDLTGQFKAMPHRDLRYGIHPVDLTELQAALADIQKFSERVTAFRKAVLTTLVTSP